MYWYAGKTSSISSPSESQRGFPCNPIRHVYSSTPPSPKHPWGPAPTPSSNKPPGSESNISIRRRREKKGFTVLISAQRSTEGKYSLTNHVMLLLRFWWITLFRAGGLPLRPLGPASSAACQPVGLLKRYLNVRLQQCAHSMTSLFVKIDYFK